MKIISYLCTIKQIKKKRIMSLGIFICVCVAIMVIDTINDPKFKEKIKNLEE